MRRVSMATRNELVEAIAARYARSDRTEKARILDEFVAVTNFHRKHAMRLLRGGASADRAAQGGGQTNATAARPIRDGIRAVAGMV